MQSLITSRRAGKLAYFLSRLLPVGVGERLARGIARRIVANPELPVVQALRINQWVAGQEQMDALQLHQAVQSSMEQLALAFLRLFRNVEDPQALDDLVDFTPDLDRLIARSQENSCGLVVAGLHMSGFDIVAQAAARRGLRAIGLTLPEADQTIEWQHAIRQRSGMVLLPSNLPNLRHALERLRAGELVLTGIDRPMPDLKYRPRFFGRPASLPTHHIYLAQKAGAPIVVMGAQYDGRRYHVLSSEEIHMRKYSDRSVEMVANAEQVLAAAQEIICRAPQQWTVPHPLWPEAAVELPDLVR